MNAKLLVGVAVIGLVAALAGVSFLSPQPDADMAGDAPVESVNIDLEIDSLSTLAVTERNATFEIGFTATNPNPGTVLLQYVKYTVRTDDQRIHVGLIGERPEGFVASSNFITILPDSAVKLDDKFSIRNTGSNPELWEAIASGTVVWSVSAEASYNHSSFVAGGEHLETFEFDAVPATRG